MKQFYLLLSFIFITITVSAQSDSLKQITDSIHRLEETTIHAYSQNTPLMTTPAAIGIIGYKELHRYNTNSILQAVNTLPGVRMEERSPNSYRFGIRGSAAQSPFGIRNIKVYYNDIPFTDAGGNTYLNQLGFYNFTGIEVIKGPASSLYGASTGGAVLISSFPQDQQNTATFHYTAGSYGTNNIAAEISSATGDVKHAIRYQHIESQGYRHQSESKKDIISWDAALKTGEKNELSAHFLYSDLHYQTPGGLTLSQYNANPTMSRPGTPTIPGAADKKAAIYQRSFLAGLTNVMALGTKWKNKTTLFATFNQLTNPNIRNYSISSQPNTGARTNFELNTHIQQSRLKWLVGGELLTQMVGEKTYTNNAGLPDSLTDDLALNNTLAFGFTQLSWLYRSWSFTAGLSLNTYKVNIINHRPSYSEKTKIYNNELAPRLAILYQLPNRNTIYASAERGFSPPSTSELAPSGSDVNLNLRAAQGWNLSIGCRGHALQERFFFDINMFLFRLSKTIVQRRDSAGGDYYINAGRTDQNGADILLKYAVIQNGRNFLKDIDLALSFTGYRFFYKEFVQLDNNYSGNRMPGVPGHTINLSMDIAAGKGLYANVNYFYSESVFLNDANTEKAVDYTLLSTRIGYKTVVSRMLLDVFLGADNILDKKYSLGNDINAIGGRYYNAAPGRNFFAGLSLGYKYR